MKKLLVFYSYTGNTRLLANKIKEKLNISMVEIKPVIPYSSDYQTVVDNAISDTKNGVTPEIEDIKFKIDDYDEIILGSPVWWYTFSSPVNSFLNAYDLDKKTIIPFITNGGWLGHTIEDLKQICPKSTIKNEICIKFNGNNIENIEEFNDWLNKIGG